MRYYREAVAWECLIEAFKSMPAEQLTRNLPITDRFGYLHRSALIAACAFDASPSTAAAAANLNVSRRLLFRRWYALQQVHSACQMSYFPLRWFNEKVRRDRFDLDGASMAAIWQQHEQDDGHRGYRAASCW